MSQNFENPYESFGHQAGPGGSRQADLNIQSKVKGPAIALMAAAVLWVIYSGYAIVMNLIGAAIVQQQQMRGGLAADQQQYIHILIGCV